MTTTIELPAGDGILSADTRVSIISQCNPEVHAALPCTVWVAYSSWSPKDGQSHHTAKTTATETAGAVKPVFGPVLPPTHHLALASSPASKAGAPAIAAPDDPHFLGVHLTKNAAMGALMTPVHKTMGEISGKDQYMGTVDSSMVEDEMMVPGMKNLKGKDVKGKNILSFVKILEDKEKGEWGVQLTGATKVWKFMMKANGRDDTLIG